MSEFHIIDVFATEKYAGNQLAVVMDASGYSTEDMLRITREFDFSETTFVTGQTDGAFDVRIFTPGAELPFAGHPTLGTAWILREQTGGDRVELNLGVGRTPVVFETQSDTEIGWLTPPTPELGPEKSREEAASLLSLGLADISPEFPVQIVTAGIPFVLVPLTSIDALHRIRLDGPLHDEVVANGLEATGFLAFCRGSHTGGSQIASRMVWQAQGSSREDPATGSATACLGGYALAHGFATDEGAGAGHRRIDVRVEQGFEMGRPSLLRIRGERRADTTTLEVGGSAFEVARGELLDK